MVEIVTSKVIREGVLDTANRVRRVYNYLSGRSSDSLDQSVPSTDKEIKAVPEVDDLVKKFKNSKAPYNVETYPSDRKIKITFDATKVPAELVDDFKPNGKYDKFISNYDRSTRQVTLLFNAKVVDSEGEIRDQEGNVAESLKEDVQLIPPEVFHDTKTDEYVLRVGIDDKMYDYVMKEGSPYTVDQMLDKVLKVMNYSHGKALAFLKKNMVVKKSPVVTESTNPFKSHFICQSCGQSLDSCTCEIKEEDIDLDEIDIEESATQPSSVGQHKVDSICLLEPKDEALNLDSEGKKLKRLISRLVLDSDDELRDYVNSIVSEVIEERNSTSTSSSD